MPASWISAPPAVNASSGSIVTRGNIRANHIDEDGQSVSVSNGSLQPQLEAFSYDWASDTITVEVGTVSGTVPLQIYVSGSVVDTINWAINVTTNANWIQAPPAATGNAGDSYVVNDIISNYVNTNGLTGLTVNATGSAITGQNYNAGTDDLTVTLGSNSGTVTLQLIDSGSNVIDTVSWSVTVNGSSSGVSTKTATNNSAFHAYEWLFLWWWTNLFSGSANGAGAPVGVDVTIELPISGGPADLPDFTGDFSNNGISTDAEGNPLPFKIRFKGDYATTDGVRGYPAAGIGSPAGSYETWGVISGNTVALMPGYRNNASQEAVSAGNAFPIFNLDTAHGAVKLPEFAGSLPSIRMVVETEDTGSSAARNVFSDTYWHDVSDLSLMPTTDEAGTNHIASLVDTRNGISGRDTRMWNLNFWYREPSFLGTGGTQVASGLEIEPGYPVDIHVKHETGGGNNFFYLAIVYRPEVTIHVVDYNAYANWMMATTTGAGTFLDEVYNKAASQAIIAKMANPDPYQYWNGTANVTNTPAPKTVRPPSADMVVDSLQIGVEMWGTENGGEAEVTFRQIGFVIDGVEYGIITDASLDIASASYQDWLDDPRNDCHRLYLCELDHSSGTVRLASRAWLSDENQAYDDWLIDTPLLQYNLDDFGALGDVDALNMDPSDNWLQHSWHGFQCRWYIGDERWPKSDFRLISTATIQGCRFVDTERFRFDLVSESAKYGRPFYYNTAQVFDETAVNALDRIFNLANSNPEYEIGSYTLFDVDQYVQMLYELSDTSDFERILRGICRGLDAYPRVTQSGQLEIISRGFGGLAEHTFDEHGIIDDSLRVVQSIDPVATVSVGYGNGQYKDVPTNAPIGITNTVRRIDTLLKEEGDAFELGLVIGARYSRAQHVWQFETAGNLELVNYGDRGIIYHPDITGSGIINDVTRRPLSDFTSVEIII